MEQDKLPCTPPDPIPCPCDREVFERVWRRVMPEDRPDSPIVVEEAAAMPAVPSEPAPSATPAVPMPAQPPAVPEPSLTATVEEADRLPNGDGIVCLGEASSIYGEQLQQYIDREIASWRAYQALARRTQGSSAKVLSTMAADERRHAKRLSTAHFLISGVRYWPADRVAAPPIRPFMAALREYFAQEQRAESSYLASAEETSDPCLRELYRELAGDENAHAWLLRGILEQL